jgi:hypothetical protein
VKFKNKWAIKAEEHEKILAREKNPERWDFYELCWYLGGSQTDVAMLDGEDVVWTDWTVCYDRKKLAILDETDVKPPLIKFGKKCAAVLKRLPDKGPLFPYLRTVRSSDRATEFHQRCQVLGIKSVSLQSYRYAWAERAAQNHVPERDAQHALGHNSKAVHRAYAKRAQVAVASLEDYEEATASAFYGTELDLEFRRRGIRHLDKYRRGKHRPVRLRIRVQSGFRGIRHGGPIGGRARADRHQDISPHWTGEKNRGHIGRSVARLIHYGFSLQPARQDSARA